MWSLDHYDQVVPELALYRYLLHANADVSDQSDSYAVSYGMLLVGEFYRLLWHAYTKGLWGHRPTD